MIDKGWIKTYELASQYYADKGNLLIPFRYIISNIANNTIFDINIIKILLLISYLYY